MNHVVLTIDDTMAFWDDTVEDYVFDPTHAHRRALVVQLAAGTTLAPAQLEAIFRYWYGDTWALGNDDGSKYVVLGVTQRPAAADEALDGLPHVVIDADATVRPAR